MGSICYFTETIDAVPRDGQGDIALEILTHGNRVVLRVSHGENKDLDIKFDDHEQMSRFLEALQDAERFNFRGKET